MEIRKIRIDLVIAIFLLVFSAIISVIAGNPKIRVPAAGVIISSILYLWISSDNPKQTPQIELPYQILYSAFIIVVAVAVVLSPVGITQGRTLFIIVISIATAIAGLIFISDGTSEKGRIGCFLLLALAFRSVIYYQYPTPAGFDTVIDHVPAILQTMSGGRITSPSYYEVYFLSQLRVVVFSLISDLHVKNSLFMSLFIPEALSGILVYVSLRRIFSSTISSMTTLIILISPFHIVYGVVRIPQATTVALVPLFIYSVLFLSRYYSVIVGSITFMAITLSHNITPWILIGFTIIYYIIERILQLSSSYSNPKIKINSALVSFFSIKVYYIFISHYYFNLGRITSIGLFLLGTRDYSGVSTTSRSAGAGVDGFIFLMFASVYLFISVFVAVAGLGVIKRIQKKRPFIADGWIIASAIFWGIFAVVTLFGPSYGTERISATILLLLSPAIAIVLREILGMKRNTIKISVLIIFLMSSAIIGGIHPRSNISEDYRTERVALTTEEVSALLWASRHSETISTESYMAHFEWLLPQQIVVHSRENLSPEGLYINRNGEYQNASTVYINSDSSIQLNL